MEAPTANWKIEQVPDTSVSSGYVRRDVRGVSLLPPGLFFYPLAGIEKPSDHDKSYPNGVIMSVTSALRRLKTSSYDGAPELMVGGGLGALGAGVGSYYGGVKSVRGINDRANALLTELNAPAVDVQLKMDKTTKDLNYLDALEYDLKRDLDRIKAKKQFDLSDFVRERKLMMKIDDVSHQVDKLDAERGLLHKQMNEILPGIEAGSAKITDEAAIAARKAARNWKIGGGLGVAAGLGALGLGLHRLAKNDPYGSLKTSSDNSTGLMVGGGLGALTGIATATKGAEGAGTRAFNQVRMKAIQKDMEALNRLKANDFSGMERLHNEARGMFPIALDNARRATRNWQIGGGLAAAAGLGALGLGIHRLAKNDPNRDAYGS